MADELNLDQNILFKQIPISNYNFANNTKWIFSIPMAHLITKDQGTNVDDHILQLPLNCQKVQFPTFTIGTTTTNYMGYSMEMSTRQNTTQKGLTISFLVSNNWLQYLMLMKWFQLNDYMNYDQSANIDKSYDAPTNNANLDYSNPYASTQGPMFPSHLYLLDNFNHRIATFHFSNSWLCRVNTVTLDYTVTDNTQIVTQFELKYYKMDIDINNEQLRKLINLPQITL